MKQLVLMIMVIAVCIGHSDAQPPDPMDGRQGTAAGPVIDRQSEPSETSSAAGAQRAYVDPQTGELVPLSRVVSPPDNQPLSPAAVSSSVETLEEEPSPVPGGGMMIDLKGGYRSPIKATIDSNGRATVECRSAAPGE